MFRVVRSLVGVPLALPPLFTQQQKSVREMDTTVLYPRPPNELTDIDNNLPEYQKQTKFTRIGLSIKRTRCAHIAV